MKRRMQRPSWFQKHKKYIYIGCGAIALGVFSFVYTVLSFKDRIPENKISKVPENYMSYSYKTNESSIRINPESLKRTEEDTNKKLAEKPKEEKVNIVIEDVKTPKKEEPTTVEVSVTPVKKEINFIKPIDGEIVLEYAKDKLVYSKTLEEWITHNGVDIKGEEAMPVKASADGKVVDKKVDPRYGNTIIIQHDDDYRSIYSNLSTLELVNIGDEVKQGDIISGVGAGYGFEVDEGAHVHWEVSKDGINIDPLK